MSNYRYSPDRTYSIEDEIKILRKALMSLGVEDKEFNDYFNFVEAKVAEGKEKKTAMDSKPAVRIKTKEKEGVNL